MELNEARVKRRRGTLLDVRSNRVHLAELSERSIDVESYNRAENLGSTAVVFNLRAFEAR